MGRIDQRQRLGQRLRAGIEITGVEPLLDVIRIDLDSKTTQAGKNGCQRLCTAHAAKTAGKQPAPGRRAREMLAYGRGKSLVGALHDALRTDVDP